LPSKLLANLDGLLEVQLRLVRIADQEHDYAEVADGDRLSAAPRSRAALQDSFIIAACISCFWAWCCSVWSSDRGCG
jgi:hypothetical protein